MGILMNEALQVKREGEAKENSEKKMNIKMMEGTGAEPESARLRQSSRARGRG